MTRRGRYPGAYALLLLAALAGCRHKAPPPPPVIAPPVKPAPITVITPLPSLPPQAKPNVQPAPVEKPVPAPAPAPVPVKHRRRLRRKPPAVPEATAAGASQSPASTAPGQTTATAPPAAASSATNKASKGAGNEAAGSTASPGSDPSTNPGSTGLPSGSTPAIEAAPALGELSTGTAINGEARTRILYDIQAQETRLLKVKKTSTSEAHAIQAQVHAFLIKARRAVAENDLDGAQTLNTKARVLLDELQSE